MSFNEKQDDPRFRERGFVAPLIFMVLFIIIIYSFLLAGLLRLSTQIIETHQLTFFSNLGMFGEPLMAVLILLGWIIFVLAISIIPYRILRAKGHFMMAEKMATIIMLLLFHIFTFPWLCWRMVRNNSPVLRRRHRQKLKAMVNSQKMQERKSERNARQQGRLRSV